MDILDDMGVSKLSPNVFLKVNYSFKLKTTYINLHLQNAFQVGLFSLAMTVSIFSSFASSSFFQHT